MITSDTAASMIAIDHLTFRYGTRGAPVFQDFSWQVAPGEAWSIIGPSGCGKTTLLTLIAGLRRATGGIDPRRRDADPASAPRNRADPAGLRPAALGDGVG